MLHEEIPQASQRLNKHIADVFNQIQLEQPINITGILEAYEHFHSLIQQATKHRELQEKIDNTEILIQKCDTLIASVLSRLRENDAKLDEFLHYKLQTYEIDPNELISYSKKISGTTSAPPLWEPGEPLGVSRPPCPQETEIRASKLFQSQFATTETTEQAQELHIEESESMHNIFQRPETGDLSGLLDL